MISVTNAKYPAEELKARSKQFAIRIVRLSQALPNAREAWVIGKQVLRSGTSVAANYRAACRARSKSEFIAKIGVVVEEIDEAIFWLELLVETGIVSKRRMSKLLAEANELMAIFAASQHTARTRSFSMDQ
ncbi:MAG: four helix bundle protein [Acidobacteriia bacterium]|nr:four helix bundle protein [Terriglobia bacterium]